MHLISCRSINGREIKRNDAVRTLVVEKDTVLVFTPTEYRIIQLLLENPILPDRKLNETFFHVKAIDSHMRKNLERHIENIKSKIRPVRFSIRRIHLYGYSLVAEDDVLEPLASSL
ncbi:MAG TPA: hypothetical protein VFV38_42955 [Ktedonobacteraceae bacterium]|nr:hypothetical protein [Ktedonobacteraceae bacterium]